MDATTRLQRRAYEGVKIAKIDYIHKLHVADPTLRKSELKEAAGIGISSTIVAEYWRMYVDGKPVHVIRPLEDTPCE